MDQDEGSLSLTASLPLIASASESCSTDSASLSEEVLVAAPSQDSTEQLLQLEYAFDAIPFQHSRKRVRVCLLYSTMSYHTMSWSSLSYLLISICPMCMYLTQAEIRKANSSQK